MLTCVPLSFMLLWLEHLSPGRLCFLWLVCPLSQLPSLVSCSGCLPAACPAWSLAPCTDGRFVCSVGDFSPGQDFAAAGGRELWLFPSIEKMGLGRGRVDGWFPGILSILHNESFDFFLRNRADTWPTRDSRHEAWSRGEKLWRGMYCSSRQKRAWLWGFWDLIKPVGYTLPRSCGFLSSHVTTSYGSSDTKDCSNRFEQ